MSTTTTEAQDLARRWAWWRTGGPDSLPKPRSTEQLAANVQRMTEMCVTAEDRERLFTWVREGEDVFAAPGGYLRLATELGITADEAAALCESVWPS